MKKLVDLFAGCGGLSLGMEQSGFEVLFANEINPHLFQTYLFNRTLDQNQYFLGDINDFNTRLKNSAENTFKDVDLVCGGPPCQGFSMANRQRVLNDPRNSLYKAFLESLNLIRPKFFLMENVKGMHNKIDEIINDFETYLGKEYSFAYKLINSKDLGLPQNRARLFILGNKIGASNEEILGNAAILKAPKAFVLADAILDLPELQPNPHKNNSSIESESVGFSEVEFNYLPSEYGDFINNRRKVNKLYNHKNRYNNLRDVEIFKRLPQGANSLHPSIVDIMPYKTRNHIFKDKYYKLKMFDVCKTITSHMKHDCNMYIHPTQARGLSPREAARVQSFPDDYIFKGTPNQWYAQIGNAVPVKLAEAIGSEIIKFI
jgi:DNA (cytosine-5)-methyltransferase 1